MRKVFGIVVALIAVSIALAGCGAAPGPAGPPLTRDVGSDRLTALHMISTDRGWATGDTVVARTADGGATFSNATPPHAAGEHLVDSPFFFNAEEAWLIYGPERGRASAYLERTRDGGVTWTRMKLPDAEDHSVRFADAQHGWMVDRSSTSDHRADEYELLRTDDGGATWTTLQSATLKIDIQPDFQKADCLTWQDPTFVTRTVGYAGINCPGGGAPSVDVTRDGGLTWTRVALPEPPARSGVPMFWSSSVVRFDSSSTGSVLVSRCVGDRMSCSDDGAVYRTEDGGRSWSAGATVLGAGVAAASDAEHIWLAGGFLDGMVPAPYLLTTSDAGRHWNALAMLPSMRPSLHGETMFQFVTASDGFAVTNQGMTGVVAFYRTTDGGRTFSQFVPRLAGL